MAGVIGHCLPNGNPLVVIVHHMPEHQMDAICDAGKIFSY
jgi:hypothetical protein